MTKGKTDIKASKSKTEAQRYLEDILDAAWRLGIEGKGIDLTEQAEEVISFLKRLGFVKVAKDQSPPSGIMVKFKAVEELPMSVQKELAETATMAYRQGQKDMVKRGWRKIEL